MSIYLSLLIRHISIDIYLYIITPKSVKSRLTNIGLFVFPSTISVLSTSPNKTN